MRAQAIIIAVAYGLISLTIVGRHHLKQSWLLAAFAGGAIAFPVALTVANLIQLLFASAFGWNMDASSTSLGIGLLGLVATAASNEVLKLAPALLAWSAARDPDGALIFGAAAGAGFGTVGASQVLQLVLIARTLPISSSAGFAAALVQQFAFVAMSTATTALAAHGAPRRRVGTYLGAAILAESLYGTLNLLFSLRVYTGMWTLAAGNALVGVLLLVCAFILSLPHRMAEGPTTAS